VDESSDRVGFDATLVVPTVSATQFGSVSGAHRKAVSPRAGSDRDVIIDDRRHHRTQHRTKLRDSDVLFQFFNLYYIQFRVFVLSFFPFLVTSIPTFHFFRIVVLFVLAGSTNNNCIITLSPPFSCPPRDPPTANRPRKHPFLPEPFCAPRVLFCCWFHRRHPAPWRPVWPPPWLAAPPRRFRCVSGGRHPKNSNKKDQATKSRPSEHKLEPLHFFLRKCNFRFWT